MIYRCVQVNVWLAQYKIGITKMSKPKVEYVVKTNRLIESLQVLSLSEVRLIQLAIVEARESGLGIKKDQPLKIHANRYAEVFKVVRGTAYDALKEAEARLFDRRFTIIDDAGKVVKSRWVQDVAYLPEENSIEICLSRVVVRETTRLDGLKQFFTSYALEQTASLKSAYSVRLYELLAQWISAKKTPVFPIEKFRQQMGIGVNEYSRMHQFKERVLEKAIDEINEKTDLTVKYEQAKTGRIISGFSFKVTKKPKPKDSPANHEQDQNTIDMFTSLTAKQILYFAPLLARLPEMGKYSEVGESYDDVATRLVEMLRDHEKSKELYPYLLMVGFQP